MGEDAANELMANDDGFEYNQQSLRIVELLESKLPNFSGLNLSYEVRDLKHKTLFDHPKDHCRALHC